MNKYIIYKIQNKINKKSYIGITDDLNDRINEHYCQAFTKNSSFLIHKALRKYGKDNFDIKIIDICNTIKQLYKLEKKYIIKYKSHCSINGYNLTHGGEGIFGYKFTKKQRLKLRNGHIGYKISDIAKLKMSIAHKGRKNSPEHNKNIANAFSKNWMLSFKGRTMKIKNLKEFCKKSNLIYTTTIRKAILQ